MLIHSASQLLTIAGTPQRGNSLGKLNILEDGAVLIGDGKIKKVGKSKELLDAYPEELKINANNKVVMPGFVDPHTHAVWAGSRAAEFELKLEGKSYLEILASGGGILSTVTETRKASFNELVDQTRDRLWKMLQYGSTTIEVKTGYGLNIESEIKMLKVVLELDNEGPWNLMPTFLGAHAIPPEYKDNTQGYTNFVCEEMLPAILEWWNENTGRKKLPFVDVFCETGAFDINQTKQIFDAARKLGFKLKVHADEFDNLGGASLAVDYKAISADHLVVTSSDDISSLGTSNTVAVALPGTPFGLGHSEYTPAKKILEADGILAIASDLNPGTTWCENMQMPIALACRFMKLTPAQAIVAATLNAAAAIDRDRDIGSIEVGKNADLLMLSVVDYRQLGYQYGTNLVKTVVKNGKVISFNEDIN
ncbi:MAG: imidazolonepropionase [Chloroflexi bacterium]|jgi:imidazolonepropionase|nr:imidazolonepropionase [Chloroflexota bacterium]MBT4003841.1 imidazolonepropionase [Chloroflexota bacterium]MBT4305857.1 imidazolonepropionase [Chloroflexota bacterium]MBT4533682.1 imidazolonepropionase [Chloroflexota bacterium]MBT4681675.1 imidazolonepropionase [Chloroflexota bacterium]